MVLGACCSILLRRMRLLPRLSLKDAEQFSTESERAYHDLTAGWGTDKEASWVVLGPDSIRSQCRAALVFPFDDRTCIELAIGAKVFTTYINGAEVVRQFEIAGWEVEAAFGEAIKRTSGSAAMNNSKRRLPVLPSASRFRKTPIETAEPGDSNRGM